MRKLLSTLLALVMLMSIASGALAADGVFTGTANGMMGPITVNVTVENDAITKVEVVSHGETPGISDPAITGIPEGIVKSNSVKVDVISGATKTSDGIKSAVSNALAGATDEVKKSLRQNSSPKSSSWARAWAAWSRP